MTSQTSALGLSTINGLPAHILIVHIVVVFVPLSGIALVIAAIRPSTARRLGIWLPAMAVIAFLSTLAAMNAGGWLQDHVRNSALVRHHTQMAGQLWPFSAAVLLLALVVWRLSSRASTDPITPQPADGPPAGSTTRTAVIAILAVVIALGSIVEVYRIGDSGARAAWHNHFSKTPTSGP